MPVNDESDQNLREEYEEAQRIAEEAIKKAKGSNTTEDYKAALKACDNANQLASQNYQRTCEANNLASNAAYQRARDLDNSQKNQLAQLQEQYEKGEISKEDYKDITTKFRAARDQAYADAKSIRELNEQANQDAFAQYNKIFAKK